MHGSSPSGSGPFQCWCSGECVPLVFLTTAQNLSPATWDQPSFRASHRGDLTYLLPAAVLFIRPTIAEQLASSPFLQVEVQRAPAFSELLFPVPSFLMLLLLSPDCPSHSAAPNFARCFLNLYYFYLLVFCVHKKYLELLNSLWCCCLGSGLGLSHLRREVAVFYLQIKDFPFKGPLWMPQPMELTTWQGDGSMSRRREKSSVRRSGTFVWVYK